MLPRLGLMTDSLPIASVTQLSGDLFLLSPQSPPIPVLVPSLSHWSFKRQLFLKMCTNDSGLREAVLQLTDTVLQLKEAVEQLANKEEDPDDILPTHIAEEEGWETARDTLQDQTKETVESWKDELNNLLVFAGLFSAVVTAFTVQSYPWLQQNPGDVSNTLLARISLQLSAFTLGSTFLNSTSPPLALSNVSISPVPYAVSVNTLWVLSLTLSLISAFFAIAVQQWLRQPRLSPIIPTRMVVSILGIRLSGLERWHVSSIVALLPLLLQIAVIFFLVGLFLLLQALNTTVAVIFGATALLGLTVFVVTTVMPLVYIHCPYKSPAVLAVIIFILLLFLSYPLILLVTLVLLSLNSILQHLPEFVRLKQLRHATAEDLFEVYRASGMSDPWFRDGTKALRLVLAVGAFCEWSLTPYIRSFGRHIFVDMGQSWVSREYQYLDSLDTAEHELSSLVSVLLTAPSRSFSKVLSCLRGFNGWYKHLIARGTVEQSLRTIVPQQHDVIGYWGQLEPEAKPYVSKWLSSRHRRLLWWVLRQRDWTQDRQIGWDDARSVALFNELDGAEFVTPQRFVKHLLHVYLNRDISEWLYFWEVRPACLLLHFIQSSSYVLNEQDAEVAYRYVLKVFDRGWNVDDDTCQLILASGALLLHALNGEGVARNCRLSGTILSALLAFLYMEGTTDRLESLIRSSYGYFGLDADYMRMSRLILNFCSAAAQYSSSHLAPGSPAHSLSRISTVFRRLCSHSDYEEKREMVEALRLLDAVEGNVDVICFSIGWELLMEGWDQFLVALAVVEEAEYTPDDDILWSGMESFLLAETRFSQSTPSDQGHDEDIDQHTDSSTISGRRALVSRTGSFRIVSAMPLPGQKNHGVDEGGAEEDPRSLLS